MRVVFYSSCSNYFDPKIVHIKTLPSWKDEWSAVAKSFPQHQFIIATMLPAMFLLDYEGAEISKPDGIDVCLLEGGGAEKIARQILALRPDVAVAASFWITPYDWLGLEDAMVADILRGQGVKVVSHSAAAQAICFDKKSASDFLRANGFSCAKSVYVDYELFWAERKKSEVCHNVYREYVFRQIERLDFPVIIKDTVGLSSYGMEVVHTAGAVKNYLESKKFNSNRLVEEFLDGPQFGTEVHVTKRGQDGSQAQDAAGVMVNQDCAAIDVFPPLLYSVNQYGICSPKQSVKLGPLTMPRFKCDELKSELERLARLLDFEGIAQVDLVFHKDKWHIIEINPRLSGSSAAIALIKGKTLPRILTDFALAAAGLEGQEGGESVPPKEDLWKERPPLYLNIKFPNLTPEQMEALYALPYVHYLCQTDNDAAKQRREMGFCEILIGGSPKPDDLLLQLKEIEEKFPKIIEPAFFDTAKKMLAFLLKNS